MKKEAIPTDILERVELELFLGEKLLWVGKPSIRRKMQLAPRRTPTWLSIMLSLELAGLLASIFISGGRAPIWLYAGLVLLLILTAVGAEVWGRYWRASKTIYAITNERALIIEGDDVHSFGAASLQEIKRRKNDLIFKTEIIRRNTGAAYGLGWHDDSVEEGFFGIEAPEQVELLLMETFMRQDKGSDAHMLEEMDVNELIEEEKERYQNRSP